MNKQSNILKEILSNQLDIESLEDLNKIINRQNFKNCEIHILAKSEFSHTDFYSTKLELDGELMRSINQMIIKDRRTKNVKLNNDLKEGENS